MEVKVLVTDIENLKTSTGLKVEKDKDGNVEDTRLITKIQFECEVTPSDIANVHRLMAAEAPVHVVIGSPQAVMEVLEEEHAFAEA